MISRAASDNQGGVRQVASEFLDYLRQPGFKRFWDAVRARYISLGRVGGRIQLADLTPTEQETLGGFLGRDLAGHDRLQVSLATVEAILLASRWQVDLATCLAAYYGAAVNTRPAMTAARERAWEDFCTRARALAGQEVSRLWLEGLLNSQTAGYRTLIGLYQEDPEATLGLLAGCCRALEAIARGLPNQPLPVFAAWLTGDPHALDQDQPLGRLFWNALLFYLGVKDADGSAEQRREFLRRVGLQDDDLSSNVLAAGLRVNAGDPLAPLLAAAGNNPLILPLRYLNRPVAWESGPVYVMENPAVFSVLLAAASPDRVPALVCPAGQPSVAAWTLLDQLAVAGCRLYYSGDFDPEGLAIGLACQRRYGAAFSPWFFDTAAYRLATRGLPLTARQRRQLAGMEIPWDQGLVPTILDRGLAIYQETLVSAMVNFMNPKEQQPA
ncbi:TIGR02679 family protein [Moorella naiadis]|uniref:TIGR02679 family protein n=1 Tax=Moorella naiadis (nom. illeg.) TaxID=3093670 RepID=UPI003D9CA76A